jgi:uncharacterized protein (UPF0333 family)
MYRYKKRAQVSLELALAMIGVVILLLGCVNTFIWLSKVMVGRQRGYDQTRVRAASVDKSSTVQERQVSENWIKKLETVK